MSLNQSTGAPLRRDVLHHTIISAGCVRHSFAFFFPRLRNRAAGVSLYFSGLRLCDLEPNVHSSVISRFVIQSPNTKHIHDVPLHLDLHVAVGVSAFILDHF